MRIIHSSWHRSNLLGGAPFDPFTLLLTGPRESVAAVTPGDVAGEPIRVVVKFIEVVGRNVLPLPVLLAALASLAATLIHAGLVQRGAIVSALADLLLGFCAVGIASIGNFFYQQPSLSFFWGDRLKPKRRNRLAWRRCCWKTTQSVCNSS